MLFLRRSSAMRAIVVVALAAVAVTGCSSGSSNGGSCPSGEMLVPAIVNVVSAGATSNACGATFQIADAEGAGVAQTQCTGSVPAFAPDDAGPSCTYPVCVPLNGGPFTVTVSEAGYGSAKVAGVRAACGGSSATVVSVTLEPAK